MWPIPAFSDFARERGVRAEYLPPGRFKTRLEPEAEDRLVALLKEAGVEWVALAGYMRMIKAPLLDAFPGRIVNIHPSLLPRFPGLEAWKQALVAGVPEAGCTVHYVDSGMDSGEIIAQSVVPVLPGDMPETLYARIQQAEHALYPAVLREIAERAARMRFAHRPMRPISRRHAFVECAIFPIVAVVDFPGTNGRIWIAAPISRRALNSSALRLSIE